MQFLRILAVCCLWGLIFKIGDLIETKLGKPTFNVVRWVFFIPLAVLGFFSAPICFDLGVFWPLLAVPGFVICGVLTVPSHNKIIGIILLLVALVFCLGGIREAWENDETRKWISFVIGWFFSLAAYIYIRSDSFND